MRHRVRGTLLGWLAAFTFVTGTAAATTDLEPAPPLPVVQPVHPARAGESTLSVISARPKGRAPAGSAIAITFSRPIVALGAAEEQRAPPARLQPAVSGSWRWTGSATAEFVPERPLPRATRFTVTVSAGLRSVDGSRLGTAYRWEFRTPAPEVLRVTPQPGDRWLPPDQRFVLAFDQPVRDLQRALRLNVGAAGTPWPFRCSKVEETGGRASPPGLGRPVDIVRYELVPGRPLPLNAPVTLTVAAGLRGEQGTLTAARGNRWSFRTFGPMEVTGIRLCGGKDQRCPRGPLAVLTTNEVALDSVRERLAVEPPVHLDWDHAEDFRPSDGTPAMALVPGDFQPGTAYRVSLSAGVRDVLGQPGRAIQATVRTADLSPDVDPGPEFVLLESAGPGALPLSVTNVTDLRARVWSLTPTEMARLLAARGAGSTHSLPEPATTSTLDTKGSPSTYRMSQVPLRTLLGGRRAALYHVELSWPSLAGSPRSVESVSGQLTDLAVHTKLGDASGLIWVTRLSSGKPVKGASLQVLDREGTVRWKGASDADGLARLPGTEQLFPPAADQQTAHFALVSATVGDDTGVCVSSGWSHLAPWSAEFESDGSDTSQAPGSLFSERGIYRPGETVHLKGILRQFFRGKVSAPPEGTPVLLEVTDPAGTRRLGRNLTLGRAGTFSTDVALDDDVPLGTFQVQARSTVNGAQLDQETTFRVAEYRAPQFEVNVTTPREQIFTGEPLSARVQARYLFGAPLQSAAVRWTVVRERTDFEPPRNDGFSFGPGFISGERPPDDATVASGEGKTDRAGSLTIDAGPAEAPGGWTYQYAIEAEATDVSREQAAARSTMRVHPAAVYVGLRRTGYGFAELGKPVTVEMVVATPAGDRLRAIPVEVSMVRREWKARSATDTSAQPDPSEVAAEKTVGTCSVRSELTPVGCTFTPGSGGTYVVRATAKDGAGRSQTTSLAVHVLGGLVSSTSRTERSLELVPDRSSYQVGDSARVLVTNPLPAAEGLLTIEREGVLSTRRVTLGPGTTTLEVPLGEEAFPNAFVSLMLVGPRVGVPAAADRGADPGVPTVHVGYAQLNVDRSAKRLTVQLSPDASKKRPGEKVRVAMRVLDSRGRGVASEVVVWAVDEGILQLTGYEAPEVVKAMHPLRPLSVELTEPLLQLMDLEDYERRRRVREVRSLSSELLRVLGLGGGRGAAGLLGKGFGDGELAMDAGGVLGGGGGQAEASSGSVRNTWRSTAFYAPSVPTDADGRGVVEFTLPDNLTTYRLMAVAVSGDRAGKGDASLVISKPLLALPAVPRVLRVGDAAEAGVVVHASTDEVKEVEVTAQVQGLRIEGPATKRVSLSRGEPREVRFQLRAETPGEAVLRFAVVGAQERDALEQRLPVRLPAALEATAFAGETRGVRSEALSIPAGVRSDVGGLEIALSSTALGGFTEAMQQLVDYPYGCLEQLSSRLVPFVALRDLAGRFGVPWQPALTQDWMAGNATGMEGQDPDTVVRKTVKTIEALQTADGGYRYWPEDRCSSEWASPYAVLALARAAELRYPVDGRALRRGQEFLERLLAPGGAVRCGSTARRELDDTTRTLAVWTLARSGAPRPAAYGALFPRRKALPLFARAMLADAMAVGGGDRKQSSLVLEEVMNQAKETAQALHVEDARGGLFRGSSDVRTTALVLLTLVDVSPSDQRIGKLVRYLMSARRRDGRYRTTQESAYALMALSEVTRVQERTAPDFVGRVRLDNKEVASAEFRKPSLDVRRASVRLEALPRTTVPLTFDFGRDGSAGILHYSALLRYAPATIPEGALDRGLIVQRWVEPLTGKGQLRSVAAGELVRVRVRVATRAERSDVAVEVPLPAGLEVVDPSLATTARMHPPAENPMDDEDQTEGSEWLSRFWTPFGHTELRDDRILLFAEELWPGVHGASFLARAITAGDFVLPPALAAEMYRPEVFGRSTAGRFQVLDSGSVAGR